MPHRPPHGCVVPGCPALALRGSRCPDHARALRAEIDSTRGSPSRRGYDAAWRRIRDAFLARHPLCVACQREGRNTAATDVDHILPLRRGGTHDPRNLQPLCRPHHSSKTAREDGRWDRTLRFGARRPA
jgi:5-methylcytosine-specific restriction protein A